MAFQHILAPTDFSAPAQQALGYAFEEAKQHEAKVTLLHVLPRQAGDEVYYLKGTPAPPMSFDPDFGGPLPLPSSTPPALHRDRYEEAMAQLRDLIPAELASRCEVRVTAGDPAEAIVRMARELAADLIVMGTHGRTGLQHVLLGSVAEKVVRHAPCPVLTIRYREAQ
ncbi:MAG: universal stress protein [Candidatus Tectimicrobiota bacterium]|nr:MAG: universal stress protein [Candidatus Tectomicrobia bacterium]